MLRVASVASLLGVPGDGRRHSDIGLVLPAATQRPDSQVVNPSQIYLAVSTTLESIGLFDLHVTRNQHPDIL